MTTTAWFASPSPRRRLTCAVCAVGVLALVCFVPALRDAHWLSDDYAFATLLRRDVDPPRFDWSEVWRQFHDRWLFSQAYWRPLVPLSYGVNQTLTGFSAWSFALGNLAMHTISCCITALLCARLTGGSARAALLGGALFAVHPLAVEPVLWISARVSTLEVLLRLSTMLAFAAYLRSRAPRTLLATALCAVAALMTKESAIALPLDLLAIDLLDCARRPLRERVALHLRLAPIWIAYFVVRRLLLGGFAGEQLLVPDVSAVLGIAREKLVVLFAPGGGALLLGAWAVAIGVSAVATWRGRRHGQVAQLGVDLCALGLVLSGVLAPGFNFALRPELVGSRLLYGAVPLLAVVLARRTGVASAGLVGRALAAVAFVGLGFALWPTTSAQLERYRAAERAMQALTEGIAAPPIALDEHRPASVLSVPAWPGIPGVIHPATVFALGVPPFGARSEPVQSLTALLEAQPYTRDDDPATVDLFGDPSPVHALLDLGAPLAWWDQAAGRLAWMVRPSLPGEEFAPGADGAVMLPAPLEPLAFEMLEIRTDGSATGGSVAWITDRGRFDGPVELPFTGGEPISGGRMFRADVSRHAPLLIAQANSIRLLGFAIRLEGGTLAGVRLLPRVPLLETGVRSDGASYRIDELEQRLRFGATTTMTGRDVVLFTRTAVHSIPVDAEGRLAVSAATRDLLLLFARHLRGDHVGWILRAQGPGAISLRSTVDWFRLRID